MPNSNVVTAKDVCPGERDVAAISKGISRREHYEEQLRPARFLSSESGETMFYWYLQ